MTHIDGVGKFIYSMICPGCGKLNPPQTDQIILCLTCEMSFKAEKFMKRLTIPITSQVFNEKMNIDFENFVVKYPRFSVPDIFRVNENLIKDKLFSIVNEMVIIDGRQIKFKTNALPPQLKEENINKEMDKNKQL